jgi:hypothetical protein|tara:strand:+ start:1620 stop:1901 length:282 start_codon:yes stop_codon:yes gene_type:complete
MTSEVVNLRERIEKVRAEMAGESNHVDYDTVKDDNNFVNNNQNDNSFADKSSKSDLPDFKLTVQNPVSPRILLFLIIMQLITSITLVAVIYLK